MPGVGVTAERPDPLVHDVDLPLAATYHPLGFRVDLATNSREILAIAAEAWERYEPVFDRPPMDLRIVVRGEDPAAVQPSFRSQRHLLSIVSDRENFALLDLKSLFGYCFVTQKTAADHGLFRWYFLDSMVYRLMEQHYVVPLHAACVAKNESGVLLCGPPGAGKSSLAFACARAGWTYIGDDATWLLQGESPGLAIGKQHQVRFRHDAPALFPELAGCSPRLRTNGKLAIEVSASAFPGIRTASQCRIGHVAFLERGGTGEPAAIPVSGEEAVSRLMSELMSYGDEGWARFENAVRPLADVPAWRLRYRDLQDGVGLLAALAAV